jgi:hypothetical protein
MSVIALCRLYPTTSRIPLRVQLRPELSAEHFQADQACAQTEHCMADERWERLVEQQGIAFAQTVAGAMNLKLDADNPADREKLRRAVLDLVAGRKMPKQKGHG